MSWRPYSLNRFSVRHSLVHGERIGFPQIEPALASQQRMQRTADDFSFSLFITPVIKPLTNGTRSWYCFVSFLASSTDTSSCSDSLLTPMPYIMPRLIVLACFRGMLAISATIVWKSVAGSSLYAFTKSRCTF